MDYVSIFSDAGRAMIGPQAAIYALAAVGLNMHFGYTGLLNFGHVVFMLVGAYGVAVTVATFGASFWLGVVVGLACAVVVALLLGVPTLRLRSDYLAIATLAVGEILRFIYRSSFAEPVTGGVYGLKQFADSFYAINPFPPGRYGVGYVSFGSQDLWVMVACWGLTVLTSLLVLALIRSPWGRVLRSVREDEQAARALGKNVFAVKMQSLVLGGVIGGLAGVMMAVDSQSVQPDSFTPVVTFYLYTLLILGGPGRIWGPVLGSVLFWFVISFTDSFLRSALGAGWISASVLAPSAIGAVRFTLVGLGLMLLMAFRPQGILGSRREMLLDA